MTASRERRRIDWRVIFPGDQPTAKLASASLPVNQLTSLTSEAMSDPSPETADRLLRHAIEFARGAIQLERAAIFLWDTKNACMVGTWGSGDRGQTVDEHALMYDYGAIDREVFDRARAGLPWTLYENCPLIAQVENETRVIGQGWVACTAILGPEGPLGILFNDTALTGAPFDEAKQWRAAILASLIGKALWRCRAFLLPSAGEPLDVRHPMVRRVTSLLVRDPSLSCETMAVELGISAGRLARIFKRETKSSIVEYRNELRLAGFLERVDVHAGNLLEAALEAGFGSYAQFHRVFRARFGRTPREYLLERNAEAASLRES